MNPQYSSKARHAPRRGADTSAFTGYGLRESPTPIAVIIAAWQPLADGTSSAASMGVWSEPFVWDGQRTAGDDSWNAPAETDRITATESDVTSRAVSELRRMSGLTWEQLGRLFGVSRRSVHFWASGRSMNAANEQHLLKVLDIVRQADRGDARSNRAALLTVSAGNAPFDLLMSQAFDEASARLGRRQQGRRVELGELDAHARAERTPPPPENLIEAMNDRVHRDAGSGRAAGTARDMRRESTG